MVECGFVFLFVAFVIVVLVLVFRDNSSKPAAVELPTVQEPPWLDVVGESHYQENIQAICGPPTEDGYDVMTSAVTRPEDDNEVDPNAIVVEIGGHTVGYLSRRDAQRYRRAYERQAFTVPARIRGGWDRGKRGSGLFGVKLQLRL